MEHKEYDDMAYHDLWNEVHRVIARIQTYHTTHNWPNLRDAAHRLEELAGVLQKRAEELGHV